jgi:RNA-binding protein
MKKIAVLTSKQRQFLKGLAHPLSPVVRVGKAGVTESVIAETTKALATHELIKVRIETDDGGSRKEMAAKLAEATSSHLAATVGKIAVLYRERDEEPEIRLPSPS